MDKIKEIRIREKDGSLSDILPIGADAKNVEMANGNSVEDEINNKASKNNLNSLNKEVKLLENRVNNLSLLEEGSTTGDAELIDGRISYDGITYDNIGNAIRAQTENINQKVYAEQRRIDTQLNKHYNIIPIGAFYQGTINNNTGAISDSTTHLYTKDVYEMINNPMHMIIADGFQVKILWYSDKEGQNIVGFNSWYSGQNTIKLENTNGKYFRLCLAKADVSAITPDDFTPDLLKFITIPDSDNIYIATSGIQKSFDSFANENKFTLVFPDIKQGHIYINTTIEGVLVDKSSNTSLYSKNRHYINADTIDISIKEGYQYQLFWIDENGKCVSGRGWYTDSQTRIVEAEYLQIGLRKADNSVFFAEEFTEDIISITYTPNGVIKDIQDTLNNLKYAILPSYWEEHIQNKIEAIKNKELITDANGDSFIFMTDSHWPSNAKNSPALIRKILDNTNIIKVFGGGDVINLHPSKSEAINYQRDFIKSFKDLNIDILNILGNHDLNNNEATYGSEAYLSIKEVYSTLFKISENNMNGMPKVSETNGDSNRNIFYYIDNPIQKIRYIILNNARSKIYYNQNDPQLLFLKEKMQELSAGWTIVAFAHIYWSGIVDGIPTENEYGTQITDLIDSLYDELDATFAALIVGHCHYDFSKNSTKGYAVISTTSDAYQLSDTDLSPVMTLGTSTEQAFDVFNIDTANRKIYTTRIGAGEDREFSY